jgi:hypothetical protein
MVSTKKLVSKWNIKRYGLSLHRQHGLVFTTDRDPMDWTEITFTKDGIVGTSPRGDLILDPNAVEVAKHKIGEGDSLPWGRGYSFHLKYRISPSEEFIIAEMAKSISTDVDAIILKELDNDDRRLDR